VRLEGGGDGAGAVLAALDPLQDRRGRHGGGGANTRGLRRNRVNPIWRPRPLAIRRRLAHGRETSAG
jgi:hypothetical protein